MKKSSLLRFLPAGPLVLGFGLSLLLACAAEPKSSVPSKATGGVTTTATGGAPTRTGGVAATGGAPVVVTKSPPSPNCTDTSSASNLLTTQFAGTYIPTENGTQKNYRCNPNWWNRNVSFNGQSVAVDGLGFTVKNPNRIGSSDNNPIGYPAIFIGSYSGSTTKLSNLPKQVSALTKVNTVFQTNANTMGSHDYNVAYDVWFTPSSAVLGTNESAPPAGGAYLMVWYFKPDNRQPRGSNRYPNKTIPGIPGTWDVWIDSTNPPCISYVANTKVESMDFDLNNFIQDSVKNSYGITSSMYLSIIFAGFEIWGGSDGLQAKAFCADVK
jgi:hypothetical protein